jgi:hypothetical protein
MITQKIVDELKAEANYYPEITVRTFIERNVLGEPQEVIYASTKVRVMEEGTWYVVPFVKCFVPNKIHTVIDFLKNVTKEVYKIKYLYRLTGIWEEIDDLQISEKERMYDLARLQIPV